MYMHMHMHISVYGDLHALFHFQHVEAGDNHGWLGARNEKPGSNVFHWLSDNSPINTKLYGEKPNQFSQSAGQVVWTGGKGGWLGDNPSTAKHSIVCEASMHVLVHLLSTH